MPKLNITQASIVSVFGTIISYLVAYVPSLHGVEPTVISIGGTVISAVFAIVHALPFHQAAKATVPVPKPPTEYKLVPVESATPNPMSHGQ